MAKAPPNPTAEVVSLFLQAAEDEDANPGSSLVGFTIRTPLERLAYIDVMARHAKVSRNEMTNELLRVGISAVWSALPAEVRDEMAPDIGEYISDN